MYDVLLKFKVRVLLHNVLYKNICELNQKYFNKLQFQ